ncbi:hypothetical protein [Chryseobacterium sp. Leaf394]|uniref:hypothetical protein n=1 Tax=Chryseobacterium sp. Leaf394 TaxID=1736361 RepID=UPI0006F4F529|nr:hypothetical protein [Chryseobacterium sp. Leaf394]KQS92857.1 hypothetical protein ASG21_10600 [Chryseobacterium sp. Leaf394]
MASTSETGHAKNIANFQTLIEFVKGYGAAYNPSKQSIQLPALLALKASADSEMANTLSKKNIYKNKVDERQLAFSNIGTLASRLVNALEITDASAGSIKNAKSFRQKILGKRATPTKESTDPNAPDPKTNSVSQKSFDQIIEHLSGLKSVLETEPSYAPNETELHVATITAKIQDLRDKTTAVNTALAELSTSRISRNKILYTEENSIYETATAVKKYIKSVFGATSPEFKQVSGLKIKGLKK